MSSNRKMTDFFKPFAEPRTKRPLTIEIAEDATAFPPTPQSDSRVKRKPFARPEETTDGSGGQIGGEKAPSLAKSVSCKSEPAMDKGLKSSQSGSNDSAGPLSPQPFSNTSSHRVIKHGEVVVTNSDDEDSDSSLDDIDSLLTLRKPAPTPSTAIGAIRSTPEGQLKRNEAMRGRLWQSSNHRGKPITSIQAVPKYKFSLDSLVSRTEKDAASEANVFRARAMMWDAGKTTEPDDDDTMEDGPKLAALKHAVKVDHGLLASVVQEETEGGGGVHSVLHAMKRTEVGNREKVWHFLDNKGMEESPQAIPFPYQSLPSKGWKNVFSDSASREQTFLSGAAGEMLALKALPDEIIQFIIDEMCIEPRDDLRFSYLLALQSVEEDQMTSLLAPKRINKMFLRLGARTEALDLKKVATPAQQEVEGWREVHGPPWANLEAVFRTLSGVAANLSQSSREHAILILTRMLLDSSLTDNGNLLLSIEDAVEQLIFRIACHELEPSLLRISSVIFDTVTQPQMRLQLLNHLPASTPTLHLFRRRLALASLLSDPSYLSKPASNLLQVPKLTQHLYSPIFNIDNDTDFTELAVMAAILDIAIDDGLSLDVLEDKDVINTFNHDIDALTARIKFLFTSILDSGASHMTRTEAKEVLERVHYRLVYTVRTKPLQRKAIFESVSTEFRGEEQAATEKGIMARFLEKQQSLKTDADGKC